MARTFNDILKGKFLVDEDAFKNWRMIIFLSFLALIMIGSSHSADKKVHEIARLKGIKPSDIPPKKIKVKGK